VPLISLTTNESRSAVVVWFEPSSVTPEKSDACGLIVGMLPGVGALLGVLVEVAVGTGVLVLVLVYAGTGVSVGVSIGVSVAV
jgi:hypothetical protein